MASSGVVIGRTKTDVIPEGQTLRPLRDYIVCKPIDVEYSKALQVVSGARKTIRGVAVAVGPGCYPWKYNANRSQRRLSAQFRPTQVKVGDVLNFGAIERGGPEFPEVFMNGEVYFIAREEDVTGIET